MKKILSIVTALSLVVTLANVYPTFSKADVSSKTTVASFVFNNSEKTSDTDLNEYAVFGDEAALTEIESRQDAGLELTTDELTNLCNSYIYLATDGTNKLSAKLSATINGTNAKHISWSKDNYKLADGTTEGITPVAGASSKNSWSETAAFSLTLDTTDFSNLTFECYLAATKKGPANYKAIASVDGNSYELGTLTLTSNKTMTKFEASLPTALNNKQNVVITVGIDKDNLKAINGDDIVGTTGGEMSINNIVVLGDKSVQDESTTSSETTTPGESIASSETTTQGESTTQIESTTLAESSTNKEITTSAIATTKIENVTTVQKPKVSVANSKVKTAVVKNKKAKLSLKKVKGASGYQIKYSTNKKFNKKTTKTVNVKKTTIVIKKIKKGKNYFFMVRAYKKVDGEMSYSSWSNIKKAKIKK